jgi:hypothetical protein
MVSIDIFVFVAYFYELRRNIDLYLQTLGPILLFAIGLRMLLAWTLTSNILNINTRIVAIFLSIPILTTEAVVRDVLFGIENVTRVIEETNNLGAYSIFIWLALTPTMLIVEQIYRSGVANSPLITTVLNNMLLLFGGIYEVVICELWRVGIILHLKRRGLVK